MRRGPAAVTAALALAAGGLGLAGALEDPAPPLPTVTAPIDPASGTVSMFPAPGTPTASPRTEVSLRGVSAAELGRLSVRGSDSGARDGELLPHSDGEGVSFVPSAPFTEGERVTVTAEHRIRGGDHAGGTSRATFTVAVMAARDPVEAPQTDPVDPEQPVYRWVSEPGLYPPRLRTVSGDPSSLDEQLVLVGVKNGYVDKGPMLVDASGEPVWFASMQDTTVMAMDAATYRGEPVLTWWEGGMGPGHGGGEVVLVDRSYREVARVAGGNGYPIDAHEVRITPEGTALVIAYVPVHLDLRPVGGRRDGQVMDGVVQEIDVATGAVLFEWHSIGQVDVRETYLGKEGTTGAWDYIHLNSVDEHEDGSLVVSGRHTCAVYRLDRVTGTLDWTLGGRESDFAMSEDAWFLKQHDARWQPDGTLSLLDNGGTCGDRTRERTRGLVLDLDGEAMTARVVRAVEHPEELYASSQASFELLPDGRALVGYGNLPRFAMFGADDTLLWDAGWHEDLRVSSYRAVLAEWEGRPATDPVVAVRQEDASLRAYVSWNGATEVDTWEVLVAGAVVAEGPRTGFETALPLPPGTAGLAVTARALDADGQALGTSAPAPVPERPQP